MTQLRGMTTEDNRKIRAAAKRAGDSVQRFDVAMSAVRAAQDQPLTDVPEQDPGAADRHQRAGLGHPSRTCTPECVKPTYGTKIQHCTVCHETYSSTSTGDAHRVGKFDPAKNDPRRCLTIGEMLALGMERDSRGIWTSGQHRTDLP